MKIVVIGGTGLIGSKTVAILQRAEIAGDLSEALEDSLHDHTDTLVKLRDVDFEPKSTA
jgi:uncharacterized protein YbjT (DUF2867 family)